MEKELVELTSKTKSNLSKDEWLDLIVENLVTDEQIDRIIENENLRNKIINLRDNSDGQSPEMVIARLIGFTEDLKD